MISKKRAKEIKKNFGYNFSKMNWEEISRYKGLSET